MIPARRTILAGTLVVGVLDILDPILFAWFYRGTAPTRILQGIAAGLLGRERAVAGGEATALLGLALHFFIAFCVVALYHLAVRRLPILVRHWIVCGAIYGMLVHLCMRHIVVPLSAIGGPPGPMPLPWRINLYFAHIFLVGIPTAYFARHSYRTRAGE